MRPLIGSSVPMCAVVASKPFGVPQNRRKRVLGMLPGEGRLRKLSVPGRAAISYAPNPCTHGSNIREHIGQPRAYLRPNQAIEGKAINIMPTKCPVMKAFSKEGKVVTIYCGLWSCPRCQKKLARLWAWRTRIQVENNNGVAWFWTLTLRGKYRTPEQGFKALPRLWDNFRKIIQRHKGKFSYIAFVEGQPKRSYMPHFHLIVMAKAPKRLKDLAMQAGFGFEADEKRVNSGKAASYVSKYASKQSPVTPRNFRRVRASRDWAKLPKGEKQEYLVKSRKETIMDFLLRVEYVTGIDIDLLKERWLDAQGFEE